MIQVLQEYLDQELEGADAARAEEIGRLKLMYRFLPKREYGPEEAIIPSALVELEVRGTRMYCFVAPQGGGLVTRVDGQPIQVVTPNSPLGEALLGRKPGETVKVELRGQTREYKVLSIR